LYTSAAMMLWIIGEIAYMFGVSVAG
jgi:hypothetical protein